MLLCCPGEFNQSFYLNSVNQSVSEPGFSATLEAPSVNQNKLSNYAPYFYFLQSSNVSSPGTYQIYLMLVFFYFDIKTVTIGSGLLIPRQYVGILSNQIGIIPEEWQAAFQCNQALGVNTMVDSNDPYALFLS